ncbi:MAG: ABC transporter permease [Gemmatimonadota bacterium]|jgi:peptide/nickel transport system permease protein
MNSATGGPTAAALLAAEAHGSGVRSRGGRPLSAVLPGLPQLLAGRWGAGATALLLWVGLLWIVLGRFSRVAASLGGAWEEQLALATVVVGIAGAWIWSWRDVSAPNELKRVGVSQWDLAVRAFSKNRTAVAGLIVILALYVVALVTPLVAPFDPALQGDLLTERLTGLSAAHPLGTDQFARDVLSRLLYGARISLLIGFVAVGISVTIGTLLGAVAGFLGGFIDGAIMRFVDMVISFPRLVLLITIIALFEPSIFLITAVLGLTLWPGTARIVRGEVLSLREREFVQAATALGFSKTRIILRHLIPNALGPVIVAATLGIGNTIVLEAGLSFLGLGVQPPTPSWGTMVADGRNVLLNAWWLSTFPGLAIVFTVLSFNLVGDGLRDALDPRLRT